jgi:hypothetical protein
VPRLSQTRVLIVADATAAGAALCEAVAARADDGKCTFTLLVPASCNGPRPIEAPTDRGARDAERLLSVSLPQLSDAVGAEVVGVVGSPDPLMAVKDALALLGFDEVIFSMQLAPLSRWRRERLPDEIRSLGVPVTEVASPGFGLDPAPAA